MKFTVLGSNGFIGKNLVDYLSELGMDVYSPDIRKEDISKKDGEPLHNLENHRKNI